MRIPPITPELLPRARGCLVDLFVQLEQPVSPERELVEAQTARPVERRFRVEPLALLSEEGLRGRVPLREEEVERRDGLLQ